LRGLERCPFIFYLDKFVALTQHSVVANNGSQSDSPGESGLYNRIAVLRAERGISRQTLADAVGVNYQTIGFLERGEYGPSLKLAFAIAAYFGLPVEAIFSTEPLKALSQQVYGAGPAAAKERA
jgi:DNA-binding XRE family transcriptional regulator